MPRRLRREEYTVGWVCALPVELAAAKAMLDETHEDIDRDISDHDENIYCMGSVQGHNVVVVCLPAGQIGNNPAAAVAAQMRAAFKGIRFGLMVGIGGGVPSAEKDIRLGDVVVSQPQQSFGGVVQYDFGKATPSGFQRTGSLNSPPQILLSAVSNVRANEMLGKSLLPDLVSTLEHIPTFKRSKTGPDVLFETSYNHEGGHTCEKCSVDRQQSRPQRESATEVVVHYGTIASGNQVIKDAAERARVSAELNGVCCFEMEAAGLMNRFPCLVIRGICDYADSHKNKQWQAYAAGTAAAYAKELLSVIPAVEVMKTRRVRDAMSSASKRQHESPSPDRGNLKRAKTVERSTAENVTAEQHLITLPIHHRKESARTLLNAEHRELLLRSLRFEQIDARQMTIKTAHAKTCRWLLKNRQYLDWLDTTKSNEHYGFLWIKGNAGTGKSTLMKFASGNARKTMKDHSVLSFFFNARGENMEKSTVGTYRSLLLQLIECLPKLQTVFDALGLSSSCISEDHEWSIEPLETLLEQAILSLGTSSVIFFIDALDECEERQIREMIQFFEHIGELAVSNGIHLQVCFSSRHYPHITIRNGLELILEGQEGHTQDISNYIEAELKIGKGKIARQIRDDLQEKASGIFMWVVLVVGILNKEYDDGQVHALRKKLQELPGDLHKLFRDILTRDSHNKGRLILCIQLVLFAKRPLSPAELYHALLSSIDLEAITQWDPEETTIGDLKRFLLNSSKGLAETTVSKEPKIQFIHESVSDFLLKENGLGKIWPELGSNFKGQSHERLKQCCLDYINIDFSMSLEIPSILPKASSEEAKSLRKSAMQKYPFLEYAVHNVLYHADTASGDDIVQKDFLKSFPSPEWINLSNLLEFHHVRRHTAGVSCLYLLAEFDMANLTKDLGLANRCMDIESERYGCALFAAAAMGSEGALELCMKCLDMQRTDESPNGIMECDDRPTSLQYTAKRDFLFSKKRGVLGALELGLERVFPSIVNSRHFEIDVRDASGATALWWAASHGYLSAVRSLLLAGSTSVNTPNLFNETPLHEAVAKGHTSIVKLLLDHSANIEARDYEGATVLEKVAYHGSQEMMLTLLEKLHHTDAHVEMLGKALGVAVSKGNRNALTLLLEKSANMDVQGEVYSSAFSRAILGGNPGFLFMLLDQGVDINADAELFGKALEAAVSTGNRNALTLLLEMCANMDVQGEVYSSAFKRAAFKGYYGILLMLLKRGIDINAPDGVDADSLSEAVFHDHGDTMLWLLDKGADVNGQCSVYGNVLQATISYNTATVDGESLAKILIERGADVNVQGGYYGNALQAAAATGREGLALLLLERGADVNAQGGHYGNALQAAVMSLYWRQDLLVSLLLDRGADVNLRGGYYGSALQAAVTTGREGLVTFLLERGADVNAQGGHYGNALQAAAANGKELVARLLLERGADVNAQGGVFSTAIRAAEYERHQAIVTLLQQSGATDALADA